MSCTITRPTKDQARRGGGEELEKPLPSESDGLVETQVGWQEVEIVVLTRNKTNNNFAIMHLLLSPSLSCRDLVLPTAFIIKKYHYYYDYYNFCRHF